LIVEKERGLVKRVMDEKISEPLLQLQVIGKDERRLLGLDIDKKNIPQITTTTTTTTTNITTTIIIMSM
jgi:hypothetical protein